jgi:hypothetical protein
VSIFLTETTTRHSLLTKHKHFHDTKQTKLTSNSGRLVGATSEAPIDLDLNAAMEPITLRHEDSDEEDAAAALAALPAAPGASGPSKRARRDTVDTEQGEDSDAFEVVSSDDEDLDDAESVHSETPGQPPRKRRKEAGATGGDGDDKKKLAMDVSYEGFSIYGRVLCLVVKRREAVPNAAGGSGRVALGAGGGNARKGRQGGGPSGQAMMENFIISTQVPAGADAPDAPDAS